MSVIPVDVAAFEAAIAESNVPVIVDFWTEWCGTCRLLSPTIEAISEEQTGEVRVLYVDANAHPELCERLQGRGIPAILLYSDGTEKARLTGSLNKHKILDALTIHANNRRMTNAVSKKNDTKESQ